MPYRIAGIDVHKRMLAVVVADVAVEGEYVFERRIVGTTPEQLRALAEWLVERRGRGSRDGIDRAVLATRVGGVGAAVATDATRPRGRRAHVRRAASRAGSVESGPRAAGRRISPMLNGW